MESVLADHHLLRIGCAKALRADARSSVGLGAAVGFRVYGGLGFRGLYGFRVLGAEGFRVYMGLGFRVPLVWRFSGLPAHDSP